MQLDLLWSYMQLDMEADKFENNMRQSPTRQKLLKNRTFLVDQQNNMKRIEDDITTMLDRFDALKDAASRLTETLAQQQKAFEDNPPSDLEQVDKMVSSMQKLIDTLQGYEQELAKMKRDAETRNRQQKEIRVRAAKAKAEYDQLKEVYNVEFKEDSEKLKNLRENAEKGEAGIDKALLDKYRTIKQHVTPPMAIMSGNQCGGCFMTLPEVMLRDIRAGERIIECDNCGRIIYIAQD
ncbi:MAG: C4-type zinc ribbon domain-containing protein [Clostridia bacterium]|nr:C4-type zinc ribbon domain-containing protein [Clostridia bacterium]